MSRHVHLQGSRPSTSTGEVGSALRKHDQCEGNHLLLLVSRIDQRFVALDPSNSVTKLDRSREKVGKLSNSTLDHMFSVRVQNSISENAKRNGQDETASSPQSERTRSFSNTGNTVHEYVECALLAADPAIQSGFSELHKAAQWVSEASLGRQKHFPFIYWKTDVENGSKNHFREQSVSRKVTSSTLRSNDQMDGHLVTFTPELKMRAQLHLDGSSPEPMYVYIDRTKPTLNSSLELDPYSTYHPILCESIVRTIDRRVETNFENKKYISRTALASIFTHTLVRELLASDQCLQFSQALMRYMGQIASVILRRAVRLYAACIYSGLSLGWFYHLLLNGLTDDALPINQCVCKLSTCSRRILRLRPIVPLFTPVTFDQSGQFQALSSDARLPFISERCVGSGSFGTVFKVRISPDCHSFTDTITDATRPFNHFALKRFDASAATQRAFNIERTALEQLKPVCHPNIIGHLASWQQRGCSFILFPLADDDLQSFLQREDSSQYQVERLLKQIEGLASAIKWIHDLRRHTKRPFNNPVLLEDDAHFICHCDLKPANILVSSVGKWKITDFGIASIGYERVQAVNPSPPKRYGTPRYEAPEVISRGLVDRASDIWALGCVYLEVALWFFGGPWLASRLSFRHAFWEKSKGHPVLHQRVRCVLESLEMSEDKILLALVMIIRACLVIDFRNRRNASDIAEKLQLIRTETELYPSDSPSTRPGVRNVRLNGLKVPFDSLPQQIISCQRLRAPVKKYRSAPAELSVLHDEFSKSLTTQRSVCNSGISASYRSRNIGSSDPMDGHALTSTDGTTPAGFPQRTCSSGRRLPVVESRLSSRPDHWSRPGSSESAISSDTTSVKYNLLTADTDYVSTPSTAHSDMHMEATQEFIDSNTLLSDPRAKAFLRHPQNYLDGLKTLELKVYDRLKSEGAFEPFSDTCKNSLQEECDDFTSLLGRYSVEDLRQNVSRCLGVLEAIDESLTYIKDIDDNDDAGFSIVVDTANSIVCRVEYISLQSIELFQRALLVIDSQLTLDHGKSIDRLEQKATLASFSALAKFSRTFFAHIGRATDQSQNMDPIKEALELAETMVRILAYGLISYTSSHTGAVSSTIISRIQSHTRYIGTDILGTVYYGRRKLACISQFLGDYVWAFKLHHDAGELGKEVALSVHLADFDDLWGPIDMIPDDSQEKLSAVKTFGGKLIAVNSKNGQAFEPLDDETLAHWTPNSHGIAPSLGFDPGKRLLVGSMCQTFTENMGCLSLDKTSMSSFDSRDIGTRDETYETSGRSLGRSWTVPKVGFGITRSRYQTKIPGLNLKTALMDQFLKRDQTDTRNYTPQREMLEYIDRPIVLEISRCTRNAQLVTIFQWLRTGEMQEWRRQRLVGETEDETLNWKTSNSFMEMWNASKPGGEERIHILDTVGDAIRIMSQTGSYADGTIWCWDSMTSKLRVFKSSLHKLFCDNKVSALFFCWSSRCLEYLYGRVCLQENPEAKGKQRMFLMPITVRCKAIQGLPVTVRGRLECIDDITRSRNAQKPQSFSCDKDDPSSTMLLSSPVQAIDSETLSIKPQVEDPRGLMLRHKATQARHNRTRQLEQDLSRAFPSSPTIGKIPPRKPRQCANPLVPIEPLRSRDMVATTPDSGTTVYHSLEGCIPYVQYHLEKSQGKLYFEDETEGLNVRIFESYDDLPLSMKHRPSMGAAFYKNDLIKRAGEKLDKVESNLGSKVGGLFPSAAGLEDDVVEMQFWRADETRAEKLEADCYILWVCVEDAVSEV